jgi:hypothetical protein
MGTDDADGWIRFPFLFFLFVFWDHAGSNLLVSLEDVAILVIDASYDVCLLQRAPRSTAGALVRHS